MSSIARLLTVVCGLLAIPASLPAGGAPAEFEVRLAALGSGKAPVPMTVSGPAAPLMRALGLTGDPAAHRLRVREGAAEMPAQWDVRGSQVACSWIAPPDAAGERVAWRAVDGSVAFFVTNLSTEPQRFAWEIDYARHRLGKAAVIAPLGEKGDARVAGPRHRREEGLPARGLLVLIARPVP